MASFTDKISQFNPFIAELPVQEMVQVGMAKQAQYNQGVQKIQSYIDNVAGMNVSRPVEKEYLKSQLDQLGSRLKTVAAGDFSNQQLVNSVAGMTGQIVKDPFIQAAVYSYSNDQRQLGDMEADEKKGKLTPHAKFVYDQKRNAFLNNPDLKDENGKPIIFTGKYIPSWDLEKNMADAIKTVGDASYTLDNIFVTDPTTGQIKYDIQKIVDPKTKKVREINNGPIYSEYAVREIHNGRFPEAVKAAINSVLNRPEAQQELGMRGVYEYRGFENVDDFINLYEKQKKDGLALYAQNKQELQAKLLNEKDPNIKKELEKMIAQVDNDSIALEKSTAEQEAAARGYKNLDAYKAALYSQNARNNYMKMFNNATVSRQYLDNPGLKAHQEVIKEERNWWKQQEDIKISKREASVKERQVTVNEREQALKEKQFDQTQLPFKPLEKPQSPGTLYSNVMDNADAASAEFEGTKRNLVKQYMALTNPNMSEAEVNKNLANMIKSDSNYIDKQYDIAKTDIIKNKDNSKYSHILPLFYQSQNSETKLVKSAAFLKNLEKEAAARVGNKYIDFANLKKGLTNFSLNTEEEDEGLIAANRGFFQAPKQHKISLSPEDQVNLAIILNTSFFKSDAEKDIVNRAKAALETSTGRPLKEIETALLKKSFKERPSQFTFSKEAPTDPYTQKLTDIAKKIQSTGFAETLNAKEEILKEQTLGDSPLAIQLYPTNAKTEVVETIDRNLTTVLNKYKEAGIDVGNFENYMAPSKDAKGKYSVQFGVDRLGVTPKFSLDLYDGNKIIQTLPLTEPDVSYIANRSIKLPEKVSDIAQTLYYNSKKTNPTYSTNDITNNPYYSDAYKGAYFTSAQLQVPNAPYLVGGDVFPNYGGGYTPYVYINQGGKINAMPILSGGVPLQYPSVDAAGELIKSIRTKSMVDEIITNVNKK